MKRDNITVTDIAGVVYQGREEEMDEYKAVYARETEARTLADVIDNADVFLGLSAAGVLKAELLKGMASQPLILALANPTPEILPEEAMAVRPDAIMATGRSDYPNQVNNVLCFPYIFKGALDVGATTINEEMKIACVQAIADLALAEPSEAVARAYGGSNMKFGPEYLIPKPFDPRLIIRVAPAVAKAAMESGVATRPIEDLKVYRQKLIHFVFQTGFLMKPLLDQAKQSPKRIVYADGEERRVLQAAQQVIEEGIAFPVLVGRPKVIEKRLIELSIKLEAGKDFEIINPLYDERYSEYWNYYHELMGRKGVSPTQAKNIVRTQSTVIASLVLKRGEVDGMLCGAVGAFSTHLRHVTHIIGKKEEVKDFSALSVLVLPSGTFFLCDTHVSPDPSAEEIVEMTLLSAEMVRQFGIKPRVALLSHSNFGTRDSESAVKMRTALALLHERDSQLVVEGEMNADAALSEEIRNQTLPGSRLSGKANLLVMPNIDAANISYNLMRMVGGGVSVGPILLGAALPVHIVNSTATVRRLVNMTAVAVVGAQSREREDAAEQQDHG